MPEQILRTTDECLHLLFDKSPIKELNLKKADAKDLRLWKHRFKIKMLSEEKKVEILKQYGFVLKEERQPLWASTKIE